MVFSQSGQFGYAASCTHDGKPPICDVETGRHQSAAWIARRGANCTSTPFHGPGGHDEMFSGNQSSRWFFSDHLADPASLILPKTSPKQVQPSHVSTGSLGP